MSHYAFIFTALLALGWSTPSLSAPDETADSEPPSSQPVVISVAPVGNLFYQLECLAQRVRCSEGAYRSHWNDIGFGGGDDEAMLQQFATTLDIYDTRVNFDRREDTEPEHVSPFGPEIVDIGPLPTESLRLLSRIQIAAYGSPNRDTLRDRLGLLMHPGDVAVIDGVIAHFLPRFESWWVTDIPESLERFTRDLETLLQVKTATFIARTAHFYRLDGIESHSPIVVHLMAHPLEQSPTTGTMIENHAVLEVLSGEDAKRRVGVMVHEIAHYFFGMASAEFHGTRLEGASRTADARGSAALSLMNESLATAIGNGVLEEQLRGAAFKDYFDLAESFYAEPQVDAAAKAIFPLVREYLDADRSLDDEFVDRYFSLVIERLGPSLDSLAARLRVSAYVASDAALSGAAQMLPRELRINSLYGSTLDSGDTVADSVLLRHSYLNGIVLMRMKDRAAFQPLVPEIGHLAILPGADSIGCTARRDSGVVLYVIVTDTPELAGSELVSMLEQSEPCSFQD